MKKYDPYELCPSCGHNRHIVRATFNLDSKSKVDERYMMRECLSCGAGFKRAPLSNEAPDQYGYTTEIDVRGDEDKPEGVCKKCEMDLEDCICREPG